MDILSSQSQYSDAMKYLQLVKSKLPEIYQTFCDKFVNYLLGRGNQARQLEIIRYVAMNFRGDSELVTGFQAFLPPRDTILNAMIKVTVWTESLTESFEFGENDPSCWDPIYIVPRAGKKKCAKSKREKEDRKPSKAKEKTGKNKRKSASSKVAKSKGSGKKVSPKVTSGAQDLKSKILQDITNIKFSTPKKMRNATDHALLYKTRTAIFSPKKSPFKVMNSQSKFRPVFPKAEPLPANSHFFPTTSSDAYIPPNSEGESSAHGILKSEVPSSSNYVCSFKVSWKPFETTDSEMKSDSESTITAPSVAPWSSQKSGEELPESSAPSHLYYEFNNLIAAVERVKKRFKKQNHIYKKFLNLLDDFQEKIGESQQNWTGFERLMLEIELYKQICQLFENKMDILPNLDIFIWNLSSVKTKVSDIDKILS